MSISENTREVLREMGLNAYEVDAYIVLLEGGQMTAMEISREASVPYSKIYEQNNKKRARVQKVSCWRALMRADKR
jgi:predicted transcriptional regulator